MPIRVLVSLSVALLACSGSALLLLPQELLAWASLPLAQKAVFAARVLGGLYLAFAALNGLASGNLLGGPRSRPVALINVLHFGAGTMLLVKAVQAGLTGSAWLAIIGIYATLAAAFGIVLFLPARKTRGNQTDA